MNNRGTKKKKDRTNLRLPPEILAAVDAERASRPGNISRNTWITEAIQEKLSREAWRSKPQEGAPDA